MPPVISGSLRSRCVDYYLPPPPPLEFHWLVLHSVSFVFLVAAASVAVVAAATVHFHFVTDRTWIEVVRSRLVDFAAAYTIVVFPHDAVHQFLPIHQCVIPIGPSFVGSGPLRDWAYFPPVQPPELRMMTLWWQQLIERLLALLVRT